MQVTANSRPDPRRPASDVVHGKSPSRMDVVWLAGVVGSVVVQHSLGEDVWLFDADDFITDWIRFQDVNGEATEYNHWYFERGTPVRHINSKGREYVTRGDRRGYYQEGNFVDIPRE